MTYGYEWTSENDVSVFWEGQEIGIADNPGDGRRVGPNGSPTGAATLVTDWLNGQDIPSDVGYSRAIEMCIALEAGDFTER